MMQGILSVLVSKPVYFLRKTSVLIIFCLVAATTQAQSLIPELSFKNPVLKTGEGCMGDGLDGAVYIFENVGWGVDALVTIQGRSSEEVHLAAADVDGPEQNAQQGTGTENAWQPQICFASGRAPSNQSWWMEFSISFVKHGHTNLPVDVKQFFVSGLDIDGDGKQLREFQTYYKVQSFSLEHQSAIFASSVQGVESDPLLKGKRFEGPVKDYQGVSLDAEDAMVSNFYSGTHFMIVRLGAKTGNTESIAANRMYGLLFKSLAMDVPHRRKQNTNLIAFR